MAIFTLKSWNFSWHLLLTCHTCVTPFGCSKH